jgi:hypothetical protein
VTPAARSAAEAVERIARERGWGIGEYAARLMAEAACSFYDDVVTGRRIAHRPQWEHPGYRDHLRQHMRRDLLDLITRQGYVPIALPHEEVRFVTGGILDPGNQHEVPESADWQTVVVTLECPVRRPPVDRADAVKAGLLNGPAPHDQ